MVKQCEANAELWMKLYNDGVRQDGAYAANYFKKLADMWRVMDSTKMGKQPITIEQKQVEPIAVPAPEIVQEATPIEQPSTDVHYHPEPQKLGFWRRLWAKLF